MVANGSGSVIFAKVQHLAQTYQQTRAQLEASLSPMFGLGEARALTWHLLEATSGQTKTALMARMHLIVPVATAAMLAQSASRVLAGEPVQYVTGVVYFGGLRLRIGPGALIPRPETEQLVAEVAAYRKQHMAPAPIQVVDVCTGSGCMALYYKTLCPADDVVGLDISPEALHWARLNATETGLDVRFTQGNALHPDTLPGGPAGLITSNPPYVPARDLTSLAPNVREHEPHLALFVPDNDPLLFYRNLAAYACQVLAPDGLLAVETYAAYAQEVADLFEANGLVSSIKEDFAGRPRFVWARPK